MDMKGKKSWVDALNSFEIANKSYVIVTVIRVESPSSAKVGNKAIISPEGEIFGWIGGGCAQPVVMKAAKDTLINGNPMMVKISPSTGKTVTKNNVREVHMACHSGGTIELLVEPRLARQNLLVIGATPVAEKLELVAPLLSIPLQRFQPGKVIDGLFECAVVATQGNKDKSSLIQALKHTTGIVYLIASTNKAAKLKEELIDDETIVKEISRIHSPAGLEIHAETPDEIAVSILAGVIKDNREQLAQMSVNDEQVA